MAECALGGAAGDYAIFGGSDACQNTIYWSGSTTEIHGNVHTNIPVNSNDYEMLQQADQVVDRVMALAESLGGVISGEHGIGITKVRYLESGAVQAFADYKSQVDPGQVFNPGKLLKGSGLQNAYTPSLRLVEQEALILEASELGELNNHI